MKIEDFSVRHNGKEVILNLKTPDGSIVGVDEALKTVNAPAPWNIEWDGADLNVTFSPPDGIGKSTSLPVVRQIGERIAQLLREG